MQKQTRSTKIASAELNKMKNEMNESKKSAESKRQELEDTKATLMASQQNFTNLDVKPNQSTLS